MATRFKAQIWNFASGTGFKYPRKTITTSIVPIKTMKSIIKKRWRKCLEVMII